MVVFLAELWDWVRNGSGHFYVLPFAWAALVWVLVMSVGRQYEPFKGEYFGTASVVIPVVAEEPELFDELLRRVGREHPHEVIVVINGPRNIELEEVVHRQPFLIDLVWTEQPGKRNALKIGIERALGDIVVLVDSDTFWTQGTLHELLRPFVDETVGGVTTHQSIRAPRRTIWTRYADWLELIRFEYTLPAQSALGKVGTLPGRTIAFRRDLIVDYLPRFVSETYLGIHKEISDDRCMTIEVLRRGYQTVYQSTATVLTDAPTTFRKFCRQQYRWANGGQYNTVRTTRWMWRHAKPLAIMTLFPLVGVYLFAAAVGAWAIAALIDANVRGSMPILSHLQIPVLILTILGSWTLTSAIRFFRIFRRHPYHLLWLGPWTIFGIIIMSPIRIIAFVRMTTDAGWGTRSGAYSGHAQVAPLRYRLLPALSVIVGFGLCMYVATAVELAR